MIDGRDLFFKPAPIAAVVLMAANDHLFKFWFHNFWTGKLSDFAGVFFLPFYGMALYSLLTGRRVGIVELVAALLATDFAFLSVKFWSPVREMYLWAQAAVGWPALVYSDPSDVLALASNALTWIYFMKFLTRDDACALNRPSLDYFFKKMVHVYPPSSKHDQSQTS